MRPCLLLLSQPTDFSFYEAIMRIDGGGGFFYHDSSDRPRLQTWVVSLRSSDGTRMKRVLFGGQVSVKQYGAKGDGPTMITSISKTALMT